MFFFIQFYNSSIDRITSSKIMRTLNSDIRSKHFQASIRPSQSLHSRLARSKPTDLSQDRKKRNPDEITVCILYKKSKIQFAVKPFTTFEQLDKHLYDHLFRYILSDSSGNFDQAAKIIKTVVGFQSLDGDINFDYRLSLKKGFIQKTKFFYPLFRTSSATHLFKYKIYNCLAIGGFSKVYLTRSLENGEFYVIKFIKKVRSQSSDTLQDRDKLQSMKNEVQVCNDLEHPFLVRLIEAFQTANFYCMVFDYCPGGQLFFLLKRVKVMNETMARFYFLQILYAFQYLHSKNIIYRDLKPENILIDADGNCKIVDFGLSKRIDSRSKTYSYCGSAEYMAPQMILRTGHSFGVDYYSLGAFLYELVTGLPPFYTKNHEQLQESIICQQLSFPPHIELSNQIRDLLQKLLKKEQKYRLGSYIGVKEILFHPWIGKVNGAEILGKIVKTPFVPDLQEYNFDTSQLGDDQEEFTELVHQDASQKNPVVQVYIKSKADNNLLINRICHIIGKYAHSLKQNQQPKSDSALYLSKQQSSSKLKQIYQSQRPNKLERINRNHSKDRFLAVNSSAESKKARQLCRLSPYLNCKQVSPKKKQEIMDFIENKIVKAPQRQLKRMKIQKNKLLAQRQ